MDIAIALILAILILLGAVQQGIFILYPLLVALGLMALAYRRRGVPWNKLYILMRQGVRQSTGVISILLLIGIVVASWLIAGTVPVLVYYGLQMLHPHWFLVAAFVLSGAISVLLGTSFGAAGTIGLALMIVARGAGVNEQWAAGAIMAGIYVGDRCSPLSSAAHLVATITDTDIYQNLQRMLATSWDSLLLSVLVYGTASWWIPLSSVESDLMASDLMAIIPSQFSVHPLTLLPAGLVIVLTLWRLPVKQTLLISLGCAIVLALSLQSQSIMTVITTLLLGLHLPDTNPLHHLFQGGGLLNMVKVCSVVLVSTAFAGLLSGVGTFNRLGYWLSRWSSDRGLLGSTIVVSTLTSAFGCTQTLAIILTQKIMHPLYTAAEISSEQLAIDIENSAVVIAPLIPWNIASFVPASILLVDASFVPCAVYLYLLPLLNWWLRRPLIVKSKL